MEEEITTTTANWLTANKLKHELKMRGCKAAGNTTELLKQLFDAINIKIPVVTIAEIERRDPSLNSLTLNAHCNELTSTSYVGCKYSNKVD